ncbi:MAG TPA: DUF3352 domain-containing protein [Solirubrobacteraceae bacterium]|nr:DUF3352 domain-containing protein [Solirubrobacteraceae bacterium]
MRVDSPHPWGRPRQDSLARERRAWGDANPWRPSRHSRQERDRRLAALAAIGLALTALAASLAGCGSSPSTGTSADPAGAVPAAAPVYAGAVVRPTGSLQSDALAAAKKLTHQADPYRRLVAVLQTPGSPALDYGRDVAPWLGPNAGIFFTSLGSSGSVESLLQQALGGGGATGTIGWPFGAGGAQGAIVLDTSDLAKARSFVAGAAAHAGAHASSYRGVAYQASSGGDAFAVVDRFVVLGSEAGVHAVIDTAQGGASLKSDASYSQLLSVAPAGALAHVYSNPRALPKGRAGAGGRGLPALLTTLGGTSPLDVSLVPSSSSIALDADVGPSPAGAASESTGRTSGLVGAAAAGNKAFGELPGESWLAAGLGKIGGAGGGLQGLQGLLSLVGTLGGSAAAETAASPQVAVSVKGVIEGLLAPLKALAANSAQARRDFESWMGEAGTFASGTSILELKAGLVIDSNDPAASRAAVAKLAAALRKTGGEATPATILGAEAAVEAKVTGLPVTLAIADGRDSSGQTKFVIGLSTTSVQDALNPPSTMSSSASYGAAQRALGEGIQPSIAVNLASLLSLLEGVGLGEDPSVSPFLPYLRASTTLSGGGKDLGGGVQRLRLVLGLQPAKS